MADPKRILHPSVAREIIADLVSEHGLEKITENLAEYCHDGVGDAVEPDILGPKQWEQALDEIREEIATMTLTCTWEDEPEAPALAPAPAPLVCGFELEDGSVAYYGVGGAK